MAASPTEEKSDKSGFDVSKLTHSGDKTGGKAPMATSAFSTSGPKPANFDRSETGHVGIINQGATCYLNSLLQCLYHTPEFRKALFDWEYKADPQDSNLADPTFCIPYQLQLLFAGLELSSQRYMTSKDLTHSFHWTSGQVFQQHDVQELLHILMDAVGKIFTKDPAMDGDYLDKIFQGMTEGYLETITQPPFKKKLREDRFKDLSLSTKAWGAKEGYSSLHECMAAYCKEEIISDYYVEELDKENLGTKLGPRHNAKKGIRFTALPKLLIVQLKRFIFDFARNQRVKLHHKIDVDRDLDMSSYVGNSDGTNVYELYGVVIHKGAGGAGGHYYAFIKPPKEKDFLKFNDASVSTLDEEGKSWRDAIGGKDANGTGYLLFYRAKSQKPVEYTIRQSLRDVITERDSKAKEELKNWEKKRRTIKIIATYKGKASEAQEIDTGETTISQLLDLFRKVHDIEDLVPRELSRLRRFDPQYGFAKDGFDGREDKTLLELRKKTNKDFVSTTNLIVETRAEDEEWPLYDEDMMLVRFLLVTEANRQNVIETDMHSRSNQYDEPPAGLQFSITIGGGANVEELRSKISATDEIDSSKPIRIIRISYDGAKEVCDVTSDAQQATLKDIKIQMGDFLYIEHGEDAAAEVSPLISAYDEYKLVITIRFNNPMKATLPGSSFVRDKSIKYNLNTRINMTYPLLTLKQQISELLQLDLNQFRLRKSTSPNHTELGTRLRGLA